MSAAQHSISLLPRFAAALGLMTIALLKTSGMMHHSMNTMSILALCITDMSIMDIANIALFWVVAFWLFLGIRTRVIASFSLVLVGIQTTLCLADLKEYLMTGHYSTGQLVFELTFISALTVALSFCAIKGGGPLSMYARGWSGLIPE